MTPILKRKPKTCEHVKDDGTSCGNYVVSAEGVQRMLDDGISLVADPAGRLCAFHSRTPQERHRMSVRGGSFSPKRAQAERQEREAEPDPMPREFAIASYRLIDRLLNAKLPTFPPEPDIRKVALGVYLAAAVYDPPHDRGTFMQQLLPRGVHMRDDTTASVEDELRTIIDELPHDQRNQAWDMLNVA